MSLLLLPGGLSLGFTVTTLLAVGVFGRRRAAFASAGASTRAAAGWPAIVLLRPCQGDDPALFDNLLSSATARYDGPRRVLVLLPGADDPAYPVACAAAAEAARRPGVPPIEVMLTGGALCLPGNPKVAQLAVGEAGSSEEFIVQADSDVLLSDDSLPGLIAALTPATAPRRCGVAFCAPIEIAPQTLSDRASAALVGLSHQSFLALFALSHLLGGTPSLAGALCAYRREALRDIGGFSALLAYLGEDYEVARRLRARGWTIALAAPPARCTDGGRTLAETVARVVRWMMVVRAQRPGLLLSYPLLLAATPALLLLSALGRSPALLVLTCLSLLARGALAVLLSRAQGLPVQWFGLGALVDVLCAEVLMWLALPGALVGREIAWRGRRYQVARGGRLLPMTRKDDEKS